jgi:Fe-S cluster assembly ATPase SufC
MHQFAMMGTSEEIKKLLSKGTYASYENCVYLGGACNVGKSTLASILIGDEIPQKWKSTDGLVIYFGRNGIDLKNRKMVPLKQGNTSKHFVNILLNGKKSLKMFLIVSCTQYCMYCLCC